MATDIRAKLDSYRRQQRDLAWKGTFEDYFTIAIKNPKIAQLAHARVYDMIMSEGVEDGPDGTPRYPFFSHQLFGLEKPVARIVEYFSAAAKRLEPRKRVLLLMGPVGGGKSTIAIMLREGLERYTRTPEGAVYAISGCPMHEEPLHLIPKDLREDIRAEYGLYVEGTLCPSCNYRLQTEWDGVIYRVPVERIVFSAENRVGLGTFAPSDPKCVTGDTILLTDRGMLRFDELQAEVGAGEDQFAPLSVTIAGRHGLEHTSHFYNGGVKPTRRLRTRFGYELEGSLVHPVLTVRNGEERWVPLGDIRVGDRIALQRGSGLFGDATELPPFSYTGPNSRGANAGMTFPTHLDERLARLLGYIVAEGSLTDTAVWITNGNRRVLDDIHALCEELFGVRPREYVKADGSCSSVSISSIRLVSWLETVCGITRGAANKRMPRVVMTAPRHVVLAFLEGWFWGDGTVSRRQDMESNRFKVATASHEMARQVQVALLNLGVVSARYKETIQQRFTAYSVVVTGDGVVDLLNLIPSLREKSTDGPRVVAKRQHGNFGATAGLQPLVLQALQEVAAVGGRTGQRYDRYAVAPTTTWGRDITPSALEQLLAESVAILGCETPTLARLREHAHSSPLWLTVQEIKEREAHVYDLTVPGSHSFCANGFINHNSQDVSELVGSIDLSMIAEIGSESDPRAYRFDGEFNISNRGIVEMVEMLKCLRGDTLVFTEHGIRRLDSFAAPDHPAGESQAMTVRLASGTGVEATAHLYHAGVSPTKRITTRRGYVQEGTAEHRLLVVDEHGAQVWRRHDELCVGDWVVLQKGQNLWGADIAIDWVTRRDRRAHPIRVPARMSPDLARWLGYLTAEGDTLSDGTVRFTNVENEVRDDYCALTRSLFGIEPRVYKSALQFNSVEVLDILTHLGYKTGAYNKEIPWSVLESSRDCVADFLSGYFAGDGTVNVGGRLSWTTASVKLATQLQVVLLNLGVVTRRAGVRNKSQSGAYGDYWMVWADGEDADVLAQAMTVLPARKRAIYEQRAAQRPRVGRSDIIPHTAAYWQALSHELQRVALPLARAANGAAYATREGARQILGKTEYSSLHEVRTGRNHCTRQTATRLLDKLDGWVSPPPGLAALLNPAQFYDEVVSIEDGEADCWDLNVPGSNTFIANGIVNHNCDEKLLYSLLTLTQEQNIKTGRFSLIYADEVVLSHTNENEFKAFAGNPKAEALHDRIILAKVPYNLRVSEEVKIYEKLLSGSNLSGVHVAPHTLHVASIFAILSRLEASKKANMTLMKKLKLYDGEDVEGWKAKDVKELQEEAQREGMDGISPRYIIDRLSNALIRSGVTCINPINALRALRDGFEQHTSFSREDREQLLNLIAETRREYDDMAKKEVQRAFVYAFEESAKTVLNNYLDNVEAYCRKDKIRDALTDEEVDPDERLMRSIEEQIGVSENGKGSFRESILMSMASLARRGKSFEYTSDERLKEAIEKKLFADLKDVIKITTSSKTPDVEQLRRINDVVDRMVKENGYCVVCAAETLQYVGQLLNR